MRWYSAATNMSHGLSFAVFILSFLGPLNYVIRIGNERDPNNALFRKIVESCCITYSPRHRQFMRWLGTTCCLLLLLGCTPVVQDKRDLNLALAEMKDALQMDPPFIEQIGAKNLALAARHDLVKDKLSLKQAASSTQALQAIGEFIQLHNKSVGRFENPEVFLSNGPLPEVGAHDMQVFGRWD